MIKELRRIQRNAWKRWLRYQGKWEETASDDPYYKKLDAEHIIDRIEDVIEILEHDKK